MKNNLEFLYQEYVRLHGVIDTLVDSSFADFQMLAVIGLMFAWKPMADKIKNVTTGSIASCRLILFGFVAILFVLSIIASRDLLKQSIIAFNISQTAYYETAIRSLLNSPPDGVFQTSLKWENWRETVHFPLSLYFRGFVVFLAMFFPAGVLWVCNRRYSLYYLATFVIVIAVYVHAFFFLSNALK